jgi:HAE1 family hydrophobic/amphiphilic exporter-1
MMARFFVNRPIVAIVISIVTILLGAVALTRLPIAQYPEIVPPMVQVTTTFTGAAAEQVEQSVATPIEQQVNGVDNMIYMKSVNANDGTLKLSVSFEVGTDLDTANMLTQNRVQQAMPTLPQSVKEYGVQTKKTLSFPLLLISLYSPNGSYDANFLSNYASININDQLSRIRGVGQLTLFGGSDYAMRVWISPDRIAKMGVTVTDIINAVKAQNQLVPAGKLGGPPAADNTEYTYTVRTKGRLLNPDEFSNIVVRSNEDGSQVRVKDVARVELGAQIYDSRGRLNGQNAAVIALYQTPGSNALEVAANIKKTIAELQTRFPDDLAYSVSLDTTIPVYEGINEIIHTLFEAVLLVILVVFVFLQNWRATLIPLLTVPVSLIGTFIVFPLLGFSVNVLSLLGLVLAIGIVVDDAIVVVEAVMHHIEKGMSPKEATIKAMSEVSGPVVAIALVLSAVFIPVAFMGGITGALYQQFAITIAISVCFSAINALTLSPALSAMLLKPHDGKRTFLTPFYDGFNRFFDRFTGGYLSIVSILIRKLFRSLIMVVLVMLFAGVIARHIPTGFVPEEDQGYLLVNVQLPDAASLDRTDATAKKVESVIANNPYVESYNTITGFSLLTGAMASNSAFFFISLKPFEERGSDGHANNVLAMLNKGFSTDIPEAMVAGFAPPAIPGLGTGAGFNMHLQDRGGNSVDYLGKNAAAFIQEAQKRPEIGKIFTLFRTDVPQVYADVDREKALKLGVDLNDLNTTLGTLLGSAYINDFNRFGRVYKVYAQAEANYRNDEKDLALFYVRSKSGEMVPLSTLVTMRSTSGPEYINRFNLYRSVELSGVPAPGYSSDQAMNALEEVAAKVLPRDMGYDWSDTSYQEKKAAGTGAIVFVFAMFLVFLILAAQYESWALPFSVILGTPFAAFGAFLGLYLARFASPSYVNNVFAQIGLVMLIGLAAKNAILIVEFAKMKREEDGLGIVDAALEAAKLRLRPILMTAFAFILGVVPLLTAAGAGAEGRKVMGMTVFSGMLVATILGVLLVPVLFVFIEKTLERISKNKIKKTMTATPVNPEH